MTSAAAHPPEQDRLPFADASPATIRKALTPKDAAEFDRHWRQVMERATERVDLAEVHEALDAWRQVAWVTSAHGAATYRRVLASAEERLWTGERANGAVPWPQLKAELGLSE